MDIYRVINQLRLERDRLDGIIRALESLELNDPSGPRRRGRKFMDDGDRKAVSERMKRYWERRRKNETSNPEPSAKRAASAVA